MQKLFRILILILAISTTVFAQNSSTSQTPRATRSAYGDRGGAEVFVTGFGSLPSQASGNAISEQATKSGGASVGYRFHLNPSSELEGRYGFSRNSQKYTIGDTVSSIPVYLSEISGSYVYNFTQFHRIQPFLEGGGGVVLFSPQNYGGGTTGSSGYGSSSSALGRQGKGMFLYGVGADLPVSSRLYFRMEFRALGFKTPNFGLQALETGALGFVYEPTAGAVFRF